MRIEGTYTFPAPIEQVFSALTHPDMLSRIIPGCERLVQLGPAIGEQPPIYELRLRRGPGTDVYTLNLTFSALQKPSHLRVDLEGHGPDGPVSGHGLVDLVQQQDTTFAAANWEIKSPVLAGLANERRSAWVGTAEQFAGAVRERTMGALRASAPDLTGVRHLTTPRGRVVVLPHRSGLLSPERQWLRRTVWIGGGILAGLAAFGVFFALVRRLAAERDDSEDASEA